MSQIIDLAATGLLTTEQAAEYLGGSENSLRTMRSKGYGPPHHRVGRAVFYRRSELDDYVAEVKERGASRAAETRP